VLCSSSLSKHEYVDLHLHNVVTNVRLQVDPVVGHIHLSLLSKAFPVDTEMSYVFNELDMSQLVH